MTAVAYAMSDVIRVSLGEPAGGCGQEHEAHDDDQGHKVIECDTCAPVLASSHPSFAAKPQDVAETPDEIGRREYLEREAKGADAALALELKRVLSLQKVAELRGNAAPDPAPVPSLEEQVKSMSAAEKNALRELLGEPKRGRPKGSTTAAAKNS